MLAHPDIPAGRRGETARPHAIERLLMQAPLHRAPHFGHSAPARLWKGPACQVTCSLDGQTAQWRREVRADFGTAKQGAQAAKVPNPGAFAIAHLEEKLKGHEFPLLLAAEWGQAQRLLPILQAPDTDRKLKLKIITLLGEMGTEDAFEPLQAVLDDSALAPTAALALGSLGPRSTPVLIRLLENSQATAVQAGRSPQPESLGESIG